MTRISPAFQSGLFQVGICVCKICDDFIHKNPTAPFQVENSIFIYYKILTDPFVHTSGRARFGIIDSQGTEILETEPLRLPKRKPNKLHQFIITIQAIDHKRISRTFRIDIVFPARINFGSVKTRSSYIAVRTGTKARVLATVPIIPVMGAFKTGLREIRHFVAFKAFSFKDCDTP